jgi:hypothetical protein
MAGVGEQLAETSHIRRLSRAGQWVGDVSGGMNDKS